VSLELKGVIQAVRLLEFSAAQTYDFRGVVELCCPLGLFGKNMYKTEQNRVVGC